MPNPYTNVAGTRRTHQREPIPGRERDMVRNDGGGYSFQLDIWDRLRRFLILGSDAGTYYVGKRELTKRNAAVVRKCLDTDASIALRLIEEVSHGGAAPSNSPALYALAMAAGHDDKPVVRSAALLYLPRIARTASHLFEFADYVEQFRGWGKGLRRAVGDWYRALAPEDLSYQLLKYRQRGGWSHKDLLRLAHVEPGPDAWRHRLLRMAAVGCPFNPDGGLTPMDREVERRKGDTVSHRLYHAHELIVCPGQPGSQAVARYAGAVELFGATSPAQAATLIHQHNLPRECVPTPLLKHKEVWDALLQKMPVGALVRNLGKLTAVGTIKPLSEESREVCRRLRNPEIIRKSRLHPLKILVAVKVYAQGRGDRGSLRWTPDAMILDALQDAFHLAFGNVGPTGKRRLIAIDCSGSMSHPMSAVAGLSGIDAASAAATLGLVSARTGDDYHIIGFAMGVKPFTLTNRDSLPDVVHKVGFNVCEGTDASVPFRYALDNRLEVDAFEVYTDGESWAGGMHPTQALRAYREKMGIPARAVWSAMTATGATLADPQDSGVLDVVGFDTSAPAVIHDFLGG